MKQVLQDMANGGTTLVEAPVPIVSRNHLLIDTMTSLISAGTERMLVDFGKANLVQKARQQPDKVKQVLAKVQTDGLMTTVDAVRSKLGQPLPLGYCNVGCVNTVGHGVEGYAKGDRVVSNGPHADVVNVPSNLCARIPDCVNDETASYTVVAAIGLQGLRLAKPTLGEAFVVTGVGLIGLLTVQLLRAQGCRVLAIDYDTEKLDLAKSFGAETCNPGIGEDPVAAGLSFSKGRGVDGVIITASSKSNDPVSQAAKMARQRGRIILVGVVGLELDRADFYAKELSFQVSCSYGPGRYDPGYEQGGQDYPYGLVRWTEQRNFEAVLDLMASGQIVTDKLTTHRFEFENAPTAYKTLTEDKASLGIVLTYDHSVEPRHQKSVVLADKETHSKSKGIVGFVGAGNYASRMLIPAFKHTDAVLHTIASTGGTSAAVVGEKAGFANATSDVEAMLNDSDIDTISIVTRHNSHSALTCRALKAGKNVFVEKPLAITHAELENIKEAISDSDKLLMVGFNRRFAPQIATMKKLLDGTNAPKSIVMTMNAGNIPKDHWTQDPEIGGGRIVGEACHYIDLMRYLVGAKITSIQAQRIGNSTAEEVAEDKAAILLGFEDGSFGTIHYLANGGSSFPKERIEVFAAGGTLQLDNFIKFRGFNWPGFTKQNLLRQDKGQTNCVKAFMKAVTDGTAPPIATKELLEVAQVTLDVADLLRSQV